MQLQIKAGAKGGKHLRGSDSCLSVTSLAETETCF